MILRARDLRSALHAADIAAVPILTNVVQSPRHFTRGFLDLLGVEGAEMYNRGERWPGLQRRGSKCQISNSNSRELEFTK